MSLRFELWQRKLRKKESALGNVAGNAHGRDLQDA